MSADVISVTGLRGGSQPFPYMPGKVHPELITTFERAIRDELAARYPDQEYEVFVAPFPNTVDVNIFDREHCQGWTQPVGPYAFLVHVLGIDRLAGIVIDQWEQPFT